MKFILITIVEALCFVAVLSLGPLVLFPLFDQRVLGHGLYSKPLAHTLLPHAPIAVVTLDTIKVVFVFFFFRMSGVLLLVLVKSIRLGSFADAASAPACCSGIKAVVGAAAPIKLGSLFLILLDIIEIVGQDAVALPQPVFKLAIVEPQASCLFGRLVDLATTAMRLVLKPLALIARTLR